jgi:hypothetical protein
VSRIGRLLELVREIVDCAHGNALVFDNGRSLPLRLCQQCGARSYADGDWLRPSLLERLRLLAGERLAAASRAPRVFVEGTFMERDDWPHVHIAKETRGDPLEQESLCGDKLHRPWSSWSVAPTAIPTCGRICPLCLRIVGVVMTAQYRPRPGKEGLS